MKTPGFLRLVAAAIVEGRTYRGVGTAAFTLDRIQPTPSSWWSSSMKRHRRSNSSGTCSRSAISDRRQFDLRFQRKSTRRGGESQNVLGLHHRPRERTTLRLYPSEHGPSKPVPHRTDIPARLAAHNAGTLAAHRQWQTVEVVTTIEFSDPERAQVFESYLKSESGRAFARRYFR